MADHTYQTDILIVGAGIAGIIAAYELLDSGRKVTIIDRDSAENFGGLAKWAFGGMLFVDTKHQRRAGIQDSFEIARDDWFSVADFMDGEVWGPRWAEQYLQMSDAHGYQWLRKHDIKFFPVINWPERGYLKRGNSLPRFHMLWGTGLELVKQFGNRLKNHPKKANLTLIFDHRVRSFVVENNRVVGVEGNREQTGEAFSVRADVTIAATGGINGSLEKVRANWYEPWGEPPKVILNGAHKYAVGDLHEATESINGQVVHLDRQWNYVAGIRHYAPRKEDHGLSIVPGKSQLWLNYEGRRFGPMPLINPYDTRYLLKRICEQPVKYSWQLLNYKIALKEFAISGSEHNESMRDKKFLKFVLKTLFVGNKKLVDKIADRCEDFVVADNLPALVDKMNALTGENHVKLAYIKRDAQVYDDQIDRGVTFHNDEQLRRILQIRKYRGDRARTCKFQKILDPKAGPLIAIRSFVLSRKSMGGIETDLQSRVLSTPDVHDNQSAIDGLYAIGEAAGFGGGNMHGHGSLEGTFLGGCVMTARVAAASIQDQEL
ncbi:MAG: FAD-binding dehydrogenase [Saprospiraceae bacterium]|nr:FAD-binding dehydrogenase [Saprospiraceae bacterium]